MYQSTTIIGRLGADPEMRYTANGDAVLNLSVAVSRRWKNKDGETVEKTTWFDVTLWGKAAEIVNQYASKGATMLFEGDVEARPWTSKDGEPRASLALNARSFRFLGGGRE